MTTPCRLGYVEYDGYQYCFEHFGWLHFTERTRRCDLARVSVNVPTPTQPEEPERPR